MKCNVIKNLIDQLNKVQISAASQSAPAAAASVATTTIKSGQRSITVKVIDQDGRQIEFQMNYDSKLGRVMTQYAARKGMPVKSLKFSFDGVRVQEEHTPEFFDMEDGDIIEVFHLTEGGCY
uniref:Small ubiquitin-related modifier n=1 Tax=Plectus sambesii TaxID=2011161 RepID=A0A914UHU0_9BILA